MKDKKSATLYHIVLLVLAEFLIMLDAAFIGFVMAAGYRINNTEMVLFWVILLAAVILRYGVERSKTN